MRIMGVVGHDVPVNPWENAPDMARCRRDSLRALPLRERWLARFGFWTLDRASRRRDRDLLRRPD